MNIKELDPATLEPYLALKSIGYTRRMHGKNPPRFVFPKVVVGRWELKPKQHVTVEDRDTFALTLPLPSEHTPSFRRKVGNRREFSLPQAIRERWTESDGGVELIDLIGGVAILPSGGVLKAIHAAIPNLSNYMVERLSSDIFYSDISIIRKVATVELVKDVLSLEDHPQL